ncbi:unnamed protein product [Rotaria sp. Silwood1]|nr:unnamed protein product [Rotaria sp. Silwood1]CAF0960151.1 unnamed protein product [Rotaria sp. Silwood1]
MRSAGFYYINNGGTVRCDACGLEVSGWTLDMKPFTIHAQRSPTCDFVRSILPDQIMSVSSTMNLLSTTSASKDDENPSERQKLEAAQQISEPCRLVEIDTLKQIRKRIFSHWPHRTSPSSAQMIEAGFFGCNFEDRVICLYCNIICQQWTHKDDPFEVHKTLSSKCPYVIAMLKRQQTASTGSINEFSNNGHSLISNSTHRLRWHEIACTTACHTNYIENSKRQKSFITWPNEGLQLVDGLVRAGFFYTGKEDIVTCFHCNGSLQSLRPNDDPLIEHVRRFPHCAYAKQSCGDELHLAIQESQQAQQECARTNELNRGTSSNAMLNTNRTISSRQLLIRDQSTYDQLVNGRLDLPISQRLLNQYFKLSIIKRCWADQLLLKNDDFVSECDLYIACLILQKQIEHISIKKEKVVIPSIKVKEIREQNAARMREQTATVFNLIGPVLSSANVRMTTSSQFSTNEFTSKSKSIGFARR